MVFFVKQLSRNKVMGFESFLILPVYFWNLPTYPVPGFCFTMLVIGMMIIMTLKQKGVFHLEFWPFNRDGHNFQTQLRMNILQ